MIPDVCLRHGLNVAVCVNEKSIGENEIPKSTVSLFASFYKHG